MTLMTEHQDWISTDDDNCGVFVTKSSADASLSNSAIIPHPIMHNDHKEQQLHPMVDSYHHYNPTPPTSTSITTIAASRSTSPTVEEMASNTVHELIHLQQPPNSPSTSTTTDNNHQEQPQMYTEIFSNNPASTPTSSTTPDIVMQSMSIALGDTSVVTQSVAPYEYDYNGGHYVEWANNGITEYTNGGYQGEIGGYEDGLTNAPSPSYFVDAASTCKFIQSFTHMYVCTYVPIKSQRTVEHAFRSFAFLILTDAFCSPRLLESATGCRR